MTLIFEHVPAAHDACGYFRSYIKCKDIPVSERKKPHYNKFAGRDVDNISQILTSALVTDNEDHLRALNELFHKLKRDLPIVVVSRIEG